MNSTQQRPHFLTSCTQALPCGGSVRVGAPPKGKYFFIKHKQLGKASDHRSSRPSSAGGHRSSLPQKGHITRRQQGEKGVPGGLDGRRGARHVPGEGSAHQGPS